MLFFLLSFLSSIFFTLVVKKMAERWRLFDRPDGSRKLHIVPRPLLGGLAIFAAFWLVVFIAGADNQFLPHIKTAQIIGIFLGSLLLVVVGVVDDCYPLSASIRLVLSAMAVIITLVAGVGLDKITNPFGPMPIDLTIFSLPFGTWGSWAFLADIIVFCWLMAMMYTTKILDGLDGLASGITLIGASMIFFLTMTKKFHQPSVGLLALILAGTLAGFLLFNFYPARIFLGEAGGLFIGFILGILAVISGGKIATTLLVMALPMLDLIRVIIRRLRQHRPLFQGDREHLHFRLLDAGFSHRGAVILLYAISFIFGITTLFLQSKFKLAALLLLGVLMAGIGLVLGRYDSSSRT